MGKSSAGKDTIYSELIGKEELHLKKVMMYTTRPIRDSEMHGREYFFVDDEAAKELECQGKIIEMRVYHTMHGEWRYFTVDDENLDLKLYDYLGIGTLESYAKIRQYYGDEKVVPVYIEVDDGVRLERALLRERLPQNRKYEEMCRRFLADAKDYSEENLKRAGIDRRFHNDKNRQECIDEIVEFIQECQTKGE